MGPEKVTNFGKDRETKDPKIALKHPHAFLPLKRDEG
jgi:uncharacterized Zn-finger protein